MKRLSILGLLLIAGCNATGDQIKAYKELTQITVDAAKQSGMAVQAQFRLTPVGGRMVQGFELYGIELNATVLANPGAQTTP